MGVASAVLPEAARACLAAGSPVRGRFERTAPVECRPAEVICAFDLAGE